MSSKRRRKARAWMQAERERHANDQREAVRQAVERLTLRLEPHPGERFVTVGQVPNHRVIKATLPPKRYLGRLGGPPAIGLTGELSQEVTLRPVLMRWQTSDGRGVCWYTWEVCDG